MSSGRRIALPEQPDKVCASCLRPRGNVRKGWQPILDRTGERIGWTCDLCPTASEPIRREVKKSGAVVWLAVVDATPTGSTTRKQRKARFASLDDARVWVAAARAELAATGKVGTVHHETVSELCERWIAMQTGVREISRQSYARMLRAPVRLLGDVAVKDVTPAMIDDLLVRLGRGEGAAEGTKADRDGARGARTVRASRGRLASAFDLGVRDGLLPTNPVRLTKAPRAKVAKGFANIAHWSWPELLKFRNEADTDDWAAVWRLSVCGLTRADVCGLRWSDVDLDAGTVTVRRGRVPLDGPAAGDDDGARYVVDDPKSAQRWRTVPVEAIHPGTVALLRGLKAQQAAHRLAAGSAWRGGDDPYVLLNEVGEPVRPEAYSERFRALVAAAGVPTIRLHAVRHSLAARLHALGVPPADAAALLGHSVEVHLSTYLPGGGESGIANAAALLAAGDRREAAG